MYEPLLQLCRAGFGVGAAQVDVALLLLDQRGAALRAHGGHGESVNLISMLGAIAQHRANNLRNHVTSLANGNQVADEHAFTLNFLLVMQRCARHRRACYRHRLQDCHWGDSSRTTHLNDDVFQHRVHFFRRVLVGDTPARGASRHTQLTLAGNIVDLDHNAVERVLNVVAVLEVVVDHVLDLLEIRHHAVMRRGGDSPGLIQFIGLRLVEHGVTAFTFLSTVLNSANTVSVEGKVTLAQHIHVLIHQSSCGRVARIGKHWLSFLLALGVDGVEGVEGEEDFAAHFEEGGDVRVRAVELLWDGTDGLDVGCNILADTPVTAGFTAGENSVFVDQVEGETVNFDLAGHFERLILPHFEAAASGIVPGAQFFDAEHIVQGEHARGVLDVGEVGALLLLGGCVVLRGSSGELRVDGVSARVGDTFVHVVGARALQQLL